MAVYPPISLWLQYAEISQYLAANATAKNMMLNGGDTVPSLSRKIYIVRKALAWKYAVDPTDESINDVALYLYAICGRFIIDAKRILGRGQSGQVINPSTGTTVTIETPVIQFTVGDVGSPMIAGDTVLTLTGYEGVINPSVEVFLDGVELPYGVSDRVSYTVSYLPTSNEVIITFNQAVSNIQLYRVRFIQLINVGIPASLGQEAGSGSGGIFVGNL